MRDYQRKAESEYYLPYSLYRRAIFLVRDYDRMAAEKANIILATAYSDSPGRSNRTSSPTEAKAVKLLKIDEDMDAIKRALQKIPPEYRDGVFDNIRYGIIPVKVPAHRNTWSKYRKRFLFFVAEEKGWT